MWGAIKGIYLAAERAIAKGWVNIVTKSGKAYKAVPAAKRGGAAAAATIKATAVTRAVFSGIGVTVAGWLAWTGINWGGKKMDDASATLGFLTIVTALTAVGVGATLILRKR